MFAAHGGRLDDLARDGGGERDAQGAAQGMAVAPAVRARQERSEVRDRLAGGALEDPCPLVFAPGDLGVAAGGLELGDRAEPALREAFEAREGALGELQVRGGLQQAAVQLDGLQFEVDLAREELHLEQALAGLVGGQLGQVGGRERGLEDGDDLALLDALSEVRQFTGRGRNEASGEGGADDRRGVGRHLDLAGHPQASDEGAGLDDLGQQADLPLLFEQEGHGIRGGLGLLGVGGRVGGRVGRGEVRVHDDRREDNRLLDLFGVDDDARVKAPGRLQGSDGDEQAVALGPGGLESLREPVGPRQLEGQGS